MPADATRRDVHQEPFVGRVTEIGQLRVSADKVLGGSPQVARIEGAAGIGKTRLINHFLDGLDGFTVLAATGDQSESALPYGLIDQLLSRADRRLVRKFPLLSHGRAPTATPFAIGADLLDLIGELQADRPLSIVVDDAQWSDTPSAQALGFTLGRLQVDRVLTVFTVQAPLLAVETDMVTQYLSKNSIESTAIKLGGLNTADIAALFASTTSDELLPSAAARLRAHTGGNPLYVKALLADATHWKVVAAGGDLPVPPSMVATVSRILNRLPNPTRRLVEALAVLNTRCSLTRVGELASLDNPSEALKPAMDAGLVQWWPSEPADSVTIGHSLHRDAVYEKLGPVRRAELHAAAARLVDDSSAWVHRVAAAPSIDAGLAQQLEQAAAQKTDSGQDDVAAQYLHWAADLSEARDEYERRMLTACVQSLLTSHPGWALSMRHEAKRCADSPLRNCALGLIALFGTGELANAENWLQRTLIRAGDADRPDWIKSIATGALAILHLLRGRADAAVRMASLALSTKQLPPRMADFVRVSHAVGRSHLEGLDTGLTELAHLPEQSSSVSNADIDSLCCRGALHTMLGHYVTAVDDLTTAVERERAGVHILSGPAPHCYLAAAQYELGQWSDAAITMHQGLSIQSTYEHPQYYTLTHMVAALVPAGRGDWSTANHHVNAAQGWAAKVATPKEMRYAAIAEATLAQARADYAGMSRALSVVRRTDWQLSESTPTWWQSWWHPLMVEALVGVGELDEAERELLRLQEAMRQVDHIADTLSRLRAGLARERGQLDEALHIYREGVAGRKDQLPFSRAMLEHEYGRLLLVTGERLEGRSWLYRARERFALLGAHPFVGRVEHDLRASGAREFENTAKDLTELTEREEQVGHLACRGLTNREIAKELFVTGKTVEYHLGNIYAKLSVTSRRELRMILDHGRSA